MKEQSCVSSAFDGREGPKRIAAVICFPNTPGVKLFSFLPPIKLTGSSSGLSTVLLSRVLGTDWRTVRYSLLYRLGVCIELGLVRFISWFAPLHPSEQFPVQSIPSANPGNHPYLPNFITPSAFQYLRSNSFLYFVSADLTFSLLCRAEVRSDQCYILHIVSQHIPQNVCERSPRSFGS